ncbi:MAG: hypothetical protein ACRC0L_03220, partial [Angustibacter sp.]
AKRCVLVIDDAHRDRYVAGHMATAQRQLVGTDIMPVQVVMLGRSRLHPVRANRLQPGMRLPRLTLEDLAGWLPHVVPHMDWSPDLVDAAYGFTRGVPWLTGQLVEKLKEAAQSDLGSPTAAGADRAVGPQSTPETDREVLTRSGLALWDRHAQDNDQLWDSLTTGEKYYLAALTELADDHGEADLEEAGDRMFQLVRQALPDEPRSRVYSEDPEESLRARGLAHVEDDEPLVLLLPWLQGWVRQQVLPPFPSAEREAAHVAPEESRYP